MSLPRQLQKSLRARAHDLKPVILVGAKGLSPALLAEANRALTDHELIKVRLQHGDRDTRQQMCRHLCSELNAELVQSIGAIAVLYRQAPQTT